MSSEYWTSKTKEMVRQYSNTFRPAWAVTVPAQNSEKPEREALDFEKGEEIGGQTDADSTEHNKEDGVGTEAPVASQLPSQESKAHTVRSYSKVFPSSWTISSKPKTPPTKIIDYGNSAGSMNRSRVPGTPQKDRIQSGRDSYNTYRMAPSPSPDQRRYHLSAESGEGHAAPQPPEGYAAASYSAPMPQYASDNIPNPPMTAKAPWDPRHTDYSWAGITLIGYDHSPDPSSVPYSVASISSAGNDVPARPPPVSSGYSSTT